MGKDTIIPIFAIMILLVAGGSSIYVYATTTESTVITIGETDYTIDQIFYIADHRSIESYTGVALDDLIVKAGISDPEHKDYTLIASDGYQKTVQWKNIENGLLTEEAQSIFSDLPKAFWVKDIIYIEVS